MEVNRPRLKPLHHHVLHVLFLFLLVVGSVYTVDTTPSSVTASPQNTAANQNGLTQQRSIYGRVIPTTSNPTGTGVTASRTYANTSFEQSDFQCFSTFNGQTWAAIGQDKMRGWQTAHSLATETNCPGYTRSGQRVIELQTNVNGNNNPYEGSVFAELNAFEATFVYQQLCMKSGESFDFTFHHKTLSANRSDILQMRFGIPSGLPAGAEAADTYSRPVMYAKTTGNTSRYASAAAFTGFSFGGTTYTTPAGTTAPVGFVTTTNGWAEYAGTHTLPVDASWNGVRNLGFQAIDGDSPNGGNLLDGITVGLSPLVDLGSSRDTAAGEQSTPTALRIRINGRVASGTKIALTTSASDAIPDTDYSIGSVTAGAYGSVTTTHTTGTNVWLFDIPAGDYDGGVVPANNKGGLNIPITYNYDLVSEGTEYVQFVISNPGVNGATSDWAKGDPTCDSSEKNDGVVYTITNVDPTNTPTQTPTRTSTPTLTPTPSGQSITFPAITDKVEGSPAFSLAATTSSGLPITYTSNSPSVCAVVGNTITIIGPGDCDIDADQPGGTTGGVTYSAATKVNRVFKVTATQWITFPPISSKVYTLPDYDTTSTASSTLPVTLTSTTPAVCTIVAGKIHYVAPGTCSVTASQAGGVVGGVTYAAAIDVTRTFPVLGVAQAITFPAVSPKNVYEPGFDLAATSDSGLPITYTSSNPSVCTVTGRKVTLFAKGTCTIVASQPGGTIGGTTYAAATSVTRSFPVSDATPTATQTATPSPTVTNTPTHTRTVTPTPIPNLLKKSAVGSSFVLGLLHNGRIITWGMNKEFQTNIPPCCGTGITDIAVGTNFALALKGGRVYGWGANTRGQITIPKLAQSRVASVSAGYAHGLALKTDGSVVCWGNNFYGQCNIPTKLKGIKQVAGGQDHTLVRLTNSTVKGYGRNTVSQITIPPTLGAVTDISAGCDHSMAIKPDGTVVAWGGNRYLQSKVPLNLKDVKSIGAGCHYSMAMMQDGTLFGWGRNENNQITIPKGITNAFSIGVGYVNSIIGLRDGSIIAIGAPEHGALVTRTPTP